MLNDAHKRVFEYAPSVYWKMVAYQNVTPGLGSEKVEMYLSTPVADPGFSREGANSRGGSQTYYFAKFLPKSA